MAEKTVIRQVLEDSASFKRFWKEKGPFAFALTSIDFPPVLLEPEEWLFSNDVELLLKDLIQFDQRRMKVVKAPFNPENTQILRPDRLSHWKINHFPEEWDGFECDLFVPQGHLTLALFETQDIRPDDMTSQNVTDLFFRQIQTCLDQLGYRLLSPRPGSKYAAIQVYLDEWEADDEEAGLI